MICSADPPPPPKVADTDTDAVRRLGAAGFQLLLHGDVHKHRDDVMNYLDDRQRILCGGWQGIWDKMEDRPESTPRLYSVDPEAGPYQAYAVYPEGVHSMKAEYTIALTAGEKAQRELAAGERR
jgi:hypothetical protein